MNAATVPADVVWIGQQDHAAGLVPIASLRHDPANAREHPAANVQALRESLRRYGQQKPIVVQADGTVIAGNGLLMAADLEGWTHIWAVRTDLQGADALGFAVADNRGAELSVWNAERLREVFRAMGGEGRADQALGFSESEVRALLDVLPAAPAAGADGESGPPGGDAFLGRAPGVELPPSHVRMVQLFLNVDTFPQFEHLVRALAKDFGTDNATDTVMECLRRAAAALEATD